MTLAARLALVPVLLLGAVAPAAAQDTSSIAAARRTAPSCDGAPPGAIVGRAVGLVGTRPSRGRSIVGCFPSQGACQRWVGRVSGLFTGRIIRADCLPN